MATAISAEEALAHPVVVAVIAAFEARIAALEAHIAMLEAALAAAPGSDGAGSSATPVAALPRKTPQNSSIPPAAAPKPSRRERRSEERAKRGPKPGHPGVSRSRVPVGQVDQVLVCRPDACEHCGAALPATGGTVVGRRQLLELPPVQPVVVEAQRVRVHCRRCQHGTVGRYPTGFTSHGGFGPRLAASAAYLHEEQHVAYARLVVLYQELFGFAISEGSLVALVGQVGAALQPAAEAITAAVRTSPVIGSDETSTRIDGVTSWHWVFQTPTAAAHLIAGRRNGDVVRRFLGEAAPAVWVSDRWKPQLGAAATAHQACLAHRLRDLQYAIDAQASPSQQAGRDWVAAVAALLRAAIHLRHAHDRGAVGDAPYAQMVGVVEDWLDRLLATPAASQWSVDLAASLRRERALLLVFLHDDRVPPTNNASERSLRPAVVHRKVTGGFRSDAAAQAYAAVRTVVETARKRGQSAFAAFLEAAGPLPPLSSPHAAAPA